jgi:predicted transcriptional regulator
MAENSSEGGYIQLTANIVSAYVSNNTVSSAEIPALISQVYSALMRVTNGGHVAAPAEPLKPAVPVKRSNTSFAWRMARNSNRSSAICARSTT